ncbi:MAG: hypothetical protein ACFFAN_12010 [Promethearchaeota archaeon]
MVHFILNGLRFNCGYKKNNCPISIKSCRECMITRLKKTGFEINSETKIFAIDGEHFQKEQELIWQKFLDVLNIKHVIIMDKNSGVALLNYPVSAVDIDTELLSGFIQANITFAESNKGLNVSSSSDREYPFYEFQYKKFNILLKNGQYIKVCIILDHKASTQMRKLVSKFLLEFETCFQNTLIEFQKTKAFQSDNMIDLIVSSFNINLVFPLTLAYAIPPEVLEEINDNLIQKAIINIAKEFLNSKAFFYINNLLDKVIKIVNLKAYLVLYNIYQLFEKGIIIPTPLETIASKLESLQEAKYQNVAKVKPISSIIINDVDMNKLKEQIKTMDEESARITVKNLIKRGKSAEKNSTYEITQKEYNKALFIAKEFNLKEDINKLSNLIFEIEKKTKQIELHFALETGENAEKSKDYINAIFYYQKALKILEEFLIYNSSDSRIKKLKKKILKIREEI